MPLEDESIICRKRLGEIYFSRLTETELVTRCRSAFNAENRLKLKIM